MDESTRIRYYARLMRFFGFSYTEVQALDDTTLQAFEQQRLIIQAEEQQSKAFE